MTFSAAKTRAICDAATPGEWFCDDRGWITVTPDETRPGEEDELLTLGDANRIDDLRLAAHARTALPAALDRIEELERALAEAVGIASMSLSHLDRNAEVKANRLLALRALLPAAKEQP